MKLQRLGRRAYNVFFHTHTVAGITISAALFVIFYAGAFALFREEIYQWENPAVRYIDHQELSVERTIAAVREAIPELAEEKRLTIRTGHAADPLPLVYGFKWDTDTTTTFFSTSVNPADGYAVTASDEPITTVGETLYRLHYFGQIPMGIYISGLVSLFFLFATVTGVMIHWQNIVQKFYAFTTRPKWKTIWTNAHTVLGVIGLPFQIIYAVTGAFYGILILLLIPAALIFYGGDSAAVRAAVVPSQGITYSDSAAVVSYEDVDGLVARAQARYPEASIRYMRFMNYGREDGTASFFYDDRQTLTGQGETVYRINTEEVLFDTPPFAGEYVTSVFSLIGRLHFATYGGIGVKIIYFVLAMLTCFMLLAGILLWQAARDKKQYTDKQKQFHHRITKFNLALCLSLFPAVAIIFLANKGVPMDWAGRTHWVDGIFFASWLVLLLLGLRWNNYRRLNANYLIIGGLLGLLVPLANGIVTGDWLFKAFAAGQHYVASVDLAWLITGVVALVGGIRTRKSPPAKEERSKRPEREAKPQKSILQPTAPVLQIKRDNPERPGMDALPDPA